MNSRILVKFSQWWQSLKQLQKALFIAGCAGILITLAVLSQLLLNPVYMPLFTELDSQNAAAVIEELESKQVPYRLTNDGKNIEVPKDQVHKLRIQMASAGVFYNNTAGFELFDEKQFGITEFEQHVGYQRALEGELCRTITQLDEVAGARVHLVLPKESVFLDDEVIPSASIALNLKTGAKLEPNQVQGIQTLVMGSVQGLTPENIYIIDKQGNVLNEARSEDNQNIATATLEVLEIERQYEVEMENRVQQKLNRIMGPGRAVAMISADLDFNREEMVKTEHGPGAVVSEQSLNESGTGASTGGIPGMDSEMPGSTMPFADGNTGSNYNKEERITNYQVDTTQQTLVKAPGEVRRLSVSVVVDGEYTEAELNSIEQVLAAAVGYNANRGDQLVVSSKSFDGAVLPSFDEPSTDTQELSLDKQLIIAGVALGVLLLLLIWLLLRRRAIKRRELMMLQQAEEEAQRLAAEEDVLNKDNILKENKTDYRALIREVAKEKPSEIVEILKVWLKE